MSYIAKGLGLLIKWIYGFTGNYGVAIILFTVIVRLILLPLNIKQQKSMLKTQAINPLLLKIRDKYKNDPQKQQLETSKLYKQYKISPFAGCLPMLIQLPVLFAFIWVIYDPGWYMFGLDTANAVNITGIQNVNLAKLTMAVQQCNLNATFLGIDLAAIPDFKSASVLWIFPLLATAATYLSGKISQSMQGEAADEKAAQTSKMMTTVFPIMTLFFTFTMPVAASFYWFISSTWQILQSIILKKLIKVDITLDDGGTWHERNSKKR